jgi:hypothetical protein
VYRWGAHVVAAGLEVSEVSWVTQRVKKKEEEEECRRLQTPHVRAMHAANGLS